MGIVSLPVLLGAILGPVVAGVLVQGPGWPSIFFLNLPIGVVATTLAWFLLPRDAGAAKARPFDLFGFLLLAPGLAGLLFGLERIGPPRGDLSAGAPILIGATVLLVGFLVVAARRKGRSLIDIRLFADRFFATASVTQFLANGAVLGGQLLLPLYLLDALHLEAAHTGWLLSVVGVGALLSYPVMGKVIDRFGPRVTTVAGAAIGLAGTLPFLFAGSIPPSMAAIVVALALRGLSIGAVSVPSIAVAYRDMPATNIAQATTALNIVQRLGGPVATTFIALALSASPLSRRAGAVPSFITAFALLAALYLVLAIVAIALPRRRSRPLSNPISHPSSTTENPS
jgi:MFS family permease